jgi:hypothetical protein
MASTGRRQVGRGRQGVDNSDRIRGRWNLRRLFRDRDLLQGIVSNSMLESGILRDHYVSPSTHRCSWPPATHAWTGRICGFTAGCSRTTPVRVIFHSSDMARGRRFDDLAGVSGM